LKEISDIVKAYHLARKDNLQTALATVVHVEGSAYRQPGARMLVTERGELTGAISGGCLEGDALRKALLVIQQQTPMLVTYDTTGEDDATIGIGLGCNGVIHILLEPIDNNNPDNPICLFERLLKQRLPSAVVTLFNLNQRKAVQPGTRLVQLGDHIIFSDIANEWIKDVKIAMIQKQSFIRSRNELTGLIAYYAPAIQLLIAGAGNDVMPLTKMAALMGWEIHIADGRLNHATTQRFPDATSLRTAKATALLKQWQPDNYSAVILMTHNYQYDLTLLRELIHTTIPYIGVLGPAKKLQRMLGEIQETDDEITPLQRVRLYGPAGLDIGAETAEEIALSIVSEIKSVMSATRPVSLRTKQTTIHARERQIIL
jgi:xanthine/CO dehydrogenase XdhC/CoxF family maturation factor